MTEVYKCDRCGDYTERGYGFTANPTTFKVPHEGHLCFDCMRSFSGWLE